MKLHSHWSKEECDAIDAAKDRYFEIFPHSSTVDAQIVNSMALSLLAGRLVSIQSRNGKMTELKFLEAKG